MRISLIGAALLALSLAGCTTSGGGVSLGGALPRPKAVVVTDFAFSSEVVAVDRGYTARLGRKSGLVPTHERKQRTAARVNDEIVAAIVATLREAGMEALAGSEEALASGDTAIVVGGRLRAAEEGRPLKKDTIGFGSGRGGVAAEVTLLLVSPGGGKKRVGGFVVRPQAGRSAAGSRPFGAGVAAALAAIDPALERLSPDVEGEARGLGRGIGEQVAAYARAQGWLTATVPAAAAVPVPQKPAKKPPMRPAEKKPVA